MGYQYSNLAGATTLAADITSGATSLTLASASGLPGTYPFTLILDPDTVAIEVVTVTGPAVAGAYPVLRGEDGTVAQAHTAGAKVIHGLVSRDLKGPQDHIAATSNVHGVTGSVVGTSDVQTLTGKTINGASNTLTVRDADIAGLAASKLTGNFPNVAIVPTIHTHGFKVDNPTGSTGDLAQFNENGSNIVRIDRLGTITAPKVTLNGGDKLDVGAWKTYTPAWTAVTTNPTFPNSPLWVGRYIYLNKNLLMVKLHLATGTGATKGSGNWRFSIPVTASANAAYGAWGDWHYFDATVGALTGTCTPVNGSSTTFECSKDGNLPLGSSAVTGDFPNSYIRATVFVEI